MEMLFLRKGKPASTPTKTGLVTRAKSNDFAFGIRTRPLFVTLAGFYCPFWADNVIPKKIILLTLKSNPNA